MSSTITADLLLPLLLVSTNNLLGLLGDCGREGKLLTASSLGVKVLLAIGARIVTQRLLAR